MFTDKLAFPKELLPCEIGDTVYTIEKHIQSWNPIKTYQYVIDDAKCEGFIIDYYNNEMRIRPAYNTWDGWVPICDDVCVDDDFRKGQYDVYGIGHCLVHTSFYEPNGGLRKEHVEKAIEILNGDSNDTGRKKKI